MKVADRIKKLFQLCSGGQRLINGWQLKIHNPHLNDLIGVIAGVKPVLICGVHYYDKDYIRALADYFELEYSFPVRKEFKQFHYENNLRDVFIGRDRKSIETAEYLWQRVLAKGDSCELEWGTILGYPECCINNYLEWRRRQVAKPVWDRERVARSVFSNTPGKTAPSFLLNNIFLYQSSINSEVKNPKERENLKLLLTKNRKQFRIDLMRMNVISWHPCSYNCPASLQKAKIIFLVMKKCFPEKAAQFEYILSRPVLFLDRFEFLVFDEAASSQEKELIKIKFNKIIPPLSLIAKEIRDKLRFQREILVRGDSVLDAGGRVILKAPSGLPVLFMDFSS